MSNLHLEYNNLKDSHVQSQQSYDKLRADYQDLQVMMEQRLHTNPPVLASTNSYDWQISVTADHIIHCFIKYKQYSTFKYVSESS